MRAMRPRVGAEFSELGDLLKDHGAKEDLMESSRAFSERRTANWKGWDNPEDRLRTPTLASLRASKAAQDAE